MKRNLILLAAALLSGCGSCGNTTLPDGGTQGSGGPGAECTEVTDCASDVCIFPDPNTPIGFCSAPCRHGSDCSKDFPGGCCVPTTDGQDVCGVAALCNDLGDAGLGDPCPSHSECAPGGFCIFSSDNSVTECTDVCQTTADCGGVSQECCEDLGEAGAPELLCVLDPNCAGTADAGPTFDGGPVGPGGDDGGPFYAAFVVNGTLTADTTSYQAAVGPAGDTLFAPARDEDIEIDLPLDFAPGVYACDGGEPMPDGGSGVRAAVSTSPGQVHGFTDLLPASWQGLTIPFQCGAGIVANAPALSVDAVELDVDAFTPGRVRTPDAGPVRGHVRGSAYWRVSDPSGANGTLEVRERFDVDLVPP